MLASRPAGQPAIQTVGLVDRQPRPARRSRLAGHISANKHKQSQKRSQRYLKMVRRPANEVLAKATSDSQRPAEAIVSS